MENLLREVEILLSVSMAQLTKEELDVADDISNQAWNLIGDLAEQYDINGQQLATATLAMLTQLIEYIIELVGHE